MQASKTTQGKQTMPSNINQQHRTATPNRYARLPNNSIVAAPQGSNPQNLKQQKHQHSVSPLRTSMQQQQLPTQQQPVLQQNSAAARSTSFGQALSQQQVETKTITFYDTRPIVNQQTHDSNGSEYAFFESFAVPAHAPHNSVSWQQQHLMSSASQGATPQQQATVIQQQPVKRSFAQALQPENQTSLTDSSFLYNSTPAPQNYYNEGAVNTRMWIHQPPPPLSSNNQSQNNFQQVLRTLPEEVSGSTATLHKKSQPSDQISNSSELAGLLKTRELATSSNGSFLLQNNAVSLEAQYRTLPKSGNRLQYDVPIQNHIQNELQLECENLQKQLQQWRGKEIAWNQERLINERSLRELKKKLEEYSSQQQLQQPAASEAQRLRKENDIALQKIIELKNELSRAKNPPENSAQRELVDESRELKIRIAQLEGHLRGCRIYKKENKQLRDEIVRLELALEQEAVRREQLNTQDLEIKRLRKLVSEQQKQLESERSTVLQCQNQLRAVEQRAENSGNNNNNNNSSLSATKTTRREALSAEKIRNSQNSNNNNNNNNSNYALSTTASAQQSKFANSAEKNNAEVFNLKQSLAQLSTEHANVIVQHQRQTKDLENKVTRLESEKRRLQVLASHSLSFPTDSPGRQQSQSDQATPGCCQN